MKTLDKYLLKSFLKPFLATFFIILFVLVMQAIWLVFDHIAGKGVTSTIILKFLWYLLLLGIPQALPIGVLLSSIMTLGNLSEKYEFAAVKSSGVSLTRMIRPLVILTLILSVLNFLCLNYVYPYARLKQLNLQQNIKQKEPSLALVAGSFNTEIPNFQIKFDEKYGEKNNLLKNVIIYDLSARKGNNKIITAKSGEFVSDQGSRYMTLVLRDGHYFEHHKTNRMSSSKIKKMPASYADFKEYTINVDISAFMDDDIETERYTKNYNMLSLGQLKDTIPYMKDNYDEYITNRSNNLIYDVRGKKLFKNDTLKNELTSDNILNNFDKKIQLKILKTSSDKAKRTFNNIKSHKETFKRKRKILNHYDIEFYNRIALSLACLLLFFIGAPLGSIIRKGGMGLPMILAILIYVLLYHFGNTMGKNMAEESSLSAITGSWIATVIMTPMAIVLTIRATRDKGLFNINGVFAPITNFFKKIFSKKGNTKEI